MSSRLAELEPRTLWETFAALTEIPRPSKHEDRVVAWVRSIAASRSDQGWSIRSDSVGNLVLDVPATPGREQAPAVALQAHLDMVCEKNQDTQHDFHRDPIRTRIEGEWVTAQGTTLGADNGIGVAAALAAALDPACQHGPLQLLFTLDEETGLTGAAGLDGSLVTARTLLNLDSEEDGKLFVGCAGGADCHLFVDPERGACRMGGPGVRLRVRGLRGGHSGLNIHEGRGNALKLLVRTLQAARDAGIDFDLAQLHGGSMHNAIPREADAWIRVSDDKEATAFKATAGRMLTAFQSELAGVDDAVTLEVATDTPPSDGMSVDAAHRLLDLLTVLPHGLTAMSRDLPGLVESSSNLAVVTNDSPIKIVTSSRSSIAASIGALVGSIAAAGRLAGAEVETHDGYPGWQPRVDSPVLQVARKAYSEIWGQDPEVTAIHAGLECGLLGEKIPGLDMISFGPQIEGAHSPDERVHIPSVERFWRALVRVLDLQSA